jgi:hypothetical protein
VLVVDDVVDDPAEQLGLGPAELLGGGRVEERAAALAVDGDDPLAQAAGQGAGEVELAAELLLGLLPPGDVLDDRHGADDGAGGVGQRGGVDGDDPLPGGRPPAHLLLEDRLAAQGAGQRDLARRIRGAVGPGHRVGRLVRAEDVPRRTASWRRGPARRRRPG